MEIITERSKTGIQAAVITISDKGAAGSRVDTSGPAICKLIEERGFQVVHTRIIPDEKLQIQEALTECADRLRLSLILTTGGTGFSPRDITPEATLAVIERVTPGIPEAMRQASMKITPRGCLSRGAAGIRGRTLIINLPGSKRAAIENLEAVLDGVTHGLEMLHSTGSSNCGEEEKASPASLTANGLKEDGGEKEKRKKGIPSMEEWIKEAKKADNADKIGMYLTHNGVVRRTARALVRNADLEKSQVTSMVRNSDQQKTEVTAMEFTYCRQQVEQVVEAAKKMEGIYYVRVWLNEGLLRVGEDIMYVLIGGDIRPHVTAAMDYLVGRIKEECVKEKEIIG